MSHVVLAALRNNVIARLQRAADRYYVTNSPDEAERMLKLADVVPSLSSDHLEALRIKIMSRNPNSYPDKHPGIWRRQVVTGDRRNAYVSDMMPQIIADGINGLHSFLGTVNVELASPYLAAPDVCVITSYFNPCGYRSRIRNVTAFALSLARSPGVAWRVIECAFGDRDFELPLSENIVHVRANSVLWQKERLLNVLVERLPDKYTKIAWIDADIIFFDPMWIRNASDRLDDYEVIQLFEAIERTTDRDWHHGNLHADLSFANLYHLQPDGPFGWNYWSHGHTGFAWAGRREWMETAGLYDGCLSGTGDHLMAHAFVGDWDPECLGIGQGAAYAHFVEWATNVYRFIRSRVHYVPGLITPLWHGPESKRDYYGAVSTLRDGGFDPYMDICRSAQGCWEWSSPKEWLHEWAKMYFVRRQEDG